MKDFLVLVTQEITVSLDETQFTDEFMREFRRSYYPFVSLEDHAKHIALLEARGLIGFPPGCFIEGYGPASEMGIDCSVGDAETEIIEGLE